MTNINKEELEKIIEEIKSKSESDSVIIITSNKTTIRKLEALFPDRTDIEIREVSVHLDLVSIENNDKCYIIPKSKPITIKYEVNKYE